MACHTTPFQRPDCYNWRVKVRCLVEYLNSLYFRVDLFFHWRNFLFVDVTVELNQWLFNLQVGLTQGIEFVAAVR